MINVVSDKQRFETLKTLAEKNSSNYSFYLFLCHPTQPLIYRFRPYDSVYLLLQTAPGLLSLVKSTSEYWDSWRREAYQSERLIQSGGSMFQVLEYFIVEQGYLYFEVKLDILEYYKQFLPSETYEKLFKHLTN